MRPLRRRLLVMLGVLSLLVLVAGWRGNGAGFEPLAAKEAPFTGAFDGRGDVITGLFIDRGKTDYVGLFGYAGAQSEISSVGVADATVVGLSAVVRLTVEGSIANLFSSGVVSGNRQVGGLVGYHNGGTFVDWDFSEAWTSVEGGDYPDLIDNSRCRLRVFARYG